MKLSLKERLAMQGLYPQNSNFVTQLLVKDVAEKVTLTQAELKKYKVVVNDRDGTIRWDQKNATDVEYKFTGAELDFLKSRFEVLDKEQKINQENFSLCQKIKEEEKGKEKSESNQ